MNTPPIVSPQEWEVAREELLAKEKELTRARDALAAERKPITQATRWLRNRFQAVVRRPGLRRRLHVQRPHTARYRALVVWLAALLLGDRFGRRLPPTPS